MNIPPKIIESCIVMSLMVIGAIATRLAAINIGMPISAIGPAIFALISFPFTYKKDEVKKKTLTMENILYSIMRSIILFLFIHYTFESLYMHTVFVYFGILSGILVFIAIFAATMQKIHKLFLFVYTILVLLTTYRVGIFEVHNMLFPYGDIEADSFTYKPIFLLIPVFTFTFIICLTTAFSKTKQIIRIHFLDSLMLLIGCVIYCVFQLSEVRNEVMTIKDQGNIILFSSGLLCLISCYIYYVRYNKRVDPTSMVFGFNAVILIAQAASFLPFIKNFFKRTLFEQQIHGIYWIIMVLEAINLVLCCIFSINHIDFMDSLSFFDFVGVLRDYNAPVRNVTIPLRARRRGRLLGATNAGHNNENNNDNIENHQENEENEG
ncbi:hypothetical protein EDEG_03214 [Edhazardia aedis USNM 41457]|uniref:Uncharacterized protein n=1 Tax=Edhazardia aedis (strain USNM 41457) TaxID=1003232 RepID=J9DIA3_EDHAE|nr:hypothetical protein EDEG_03214 [Edhazardia aedis USNM 41457]|eukprot:EJW02355.1 hypothetical protein EDEG_03214 [Edhazardia aedis USNM 41457]